jgi:RNA-dependent RNA polymerase
MHSILSQFSSEIFHIAQSNTLSHRNDRHLSEVEVFLGTITAPSKVRRHRDDLIARLQLHTTTLFEATRDGIAGGEEADDSAGTVEAVEQRTLRAWAAWMTAVEAEGSEFGVKSFGWVALQLVFEAMRELDGEEE